MRKLQNIFTFTSILMLVAIPVSAHMDEKMEHHGGHEMRHDGKHETGHRSGHGMGHHAGHEARHHGEYETGQHGGHEVEHAGGQNLGHHTGNETEHHGGHETGWHSGHEIGHHAGHARHIFGPSWEETLSDKQKLQADKMHLALKKSLSGPNSQLNMKKAKLNRLVLKDNPDKKVISQEIAEIMELKREIMHKKNDHMVELRSILTPEQKVSFDLKHKTS